MLFNAAKDSFRLWRSFGILSIGFGNLWDSLTFFRDDFRIVWDRKINNLSKDSLNCTWAAFLELLRILLVLKI